MARRGYCKSNRASFVYFDPFGESWLWYKKNFRAVMLPNSGAGRVAILFCRSSKTRFGLSSLVRPGEPERLAPRAKVKCGVKARSSLGIPSDAILSSIADAKVESCGPASVPNQKTRADFTVGKNPNPRNRMSTALAAMVVKTCLICSTAGSSCSPMNFKVTCKDSGRAHRASGAKGLTSSTKRAMRNRMSSSMSSAIKSRMGKACGVSSRLSTFGLTVNLTGKYFGMLWLPPVLYIRSRIQTSSEAQSGPTSSASSAYPAP